jgi:hypothetical protein
MKKRPPESDEMKSHYDIPWDKAVRNKYAKAFAGVTLFVPIDPELQKHFPTADAVNKALRSLVRKSSKPVARQPRVAAAKKKSRTSR